MGGGAVEGRARVRTRCELGLRCSVENTPRCWSRSLKGGSKLLPFPLSVCSLLSQHWHHSSEGSYTGEEGQEQPTQCGLGHAPGLSWHIRVHTTLHLLPLGVLVIAAAKSLQSCLTLCDPIDGSPPGSPVCGILQARTLEWVAISFSNV